MRSMCASTSTATGTQVHQQEAAAAAWCVLEATTTVVRWSAGRGERWRTLVMSSALAATATRRLRTPYTRTRRTAASRPTMGLSLVSAQSYVSSCLRTFTLCLRICTRGPGAAGATPPPPVAVTIPLSSLISPRWTVRAVRLTRSQTWSRTSASTTCCSRCTAAAAPFPTLPSSQGAGRPKGRWPCTAPAGPTARHTGWCGARTKC
mmetsp:Transcript_18957/g.44975  ORF Transcript_18957/g.44975 Transcript_18957/m.44975 type:complete len:206 (+) Transcript_18957:176-793(+)